MRGTSSGNFMRISQGFSPDRLKQASIPSFHFSNLLEYFEVIIVHDNQKEWPVFMLRIVTIAVSLVLSACLVGPQYKEPIKRAARHWKINDRLISEAPIQNADWWQVFHDENLTALIHQGYEENLTLQGAGVHVLQMRAQLAESVGSLYPQQQALMGNYTYQRIGGGSLQDVLPSNFLTALLGFTASWEVDFWGKYRRAIRAHDAAFLASFAAYDNALVSLTSDIATTYVNIRTTEALISITKKNVAVQRIGLKLARSRYKAGQTSLLDVEQAQTQLSQTEAALPMYHAALQQQKDLLAVLLGTTPDRIDCLLIKGRPIPKAPRSVAVGIPVETLMKRPDIYEARLEALAQSETIGAIKANLYPAFSLTGTFAFASNNIGANSISQIFNWSNRTITAGPSFTWPIFNYGQITNAVRVQDAVFQQALLNYLNLVLKAQQEVQDQITQFIETQRAARYLTTANTAAIKSTKLALIRYREGESDYTPVLDSLRQQLSVETKLTKAHGDIPKALIGLYRALGGGWQMRGCKDIVPTAMKAEMAWRTNWGNLLKPQNHLPPGSRMQELKELYLPNW